MARIVSFLSFSFLGDESAVIIQGKREFNANSPGWIWVARRACEAGKKKKKQNNNTVAQSKW